MLSSRQWDFLRRLLDLYRETKAPVRYVDVARALEVSPVTAYEMLRLLEDKLLVGSDMVRPQGRRGRSVVVFYPTDRATALLGSLVGDRLSEEEWEKVKERIAGYRFVTADRGGETMAGWIEKSMLLGLGVLTLTRDKVKQLVDRLVEEGEVKAEEAPTVIDRLVVRGEEERAELHKLVHQELDKARASIPLASRKDIEALSQKIDALTARVEALAAEKPARMSASGRKQAS